ncbi:MAG: DUF302 domain-containing protein [Candidatus Eisenbacteria bacterium]|nr:DUF302 domain-containing protein [Candidatus Latescibacterota bacterium]MBD3300878.1 DUF302 domain-containing protein [Candidatus Eisenbacteria bacterium]
MTDKGRYGFSVRIRAPYEKARERTIDALKQEGFGVLTEIDVKSTLKQKLDAEFRKYAILGACNPPLAHRALSEEPHIGLLLPCNFIVYENDDGTSTVAGIDPEVQLGVVGRPELAGLAQEVRGRVDAILRSLEDPEGSGSR